MLCYLSSLKIARTKNNSTNDTTALETTGNGSKQKDESFTNLSNTTATLSSNIIDASSSISDTDNSIPDNKMADKESADKSKDELIVSSTVDNSPSNVSDRDLIRQAEEQYAESRLFLAAECLKKVSNQSLLDAKHRRIQEMAQMAADLKDQLMTPRPDEWKKQGECHGQRDTIIYYKIAPDNAIVCRVETPIESSLLVPLLSVLNESDLYGSWMPSYKFPKLGVSKSKVLKRFGRGHQILDLCFHMPFPFQHRQNIQHGYAVDSIDADKCIIIKVEGMDTGKHFEIEIPEPAKGYKRVDFDAGFLVRSCPPDHPSFAKSKHKYPADEKLLLVSFLQHLNLRVAGIPLSFINFFSRTVMGQLWGELLQVAEDIKTGKRPAHKMAIEKNAELYGWVNERVQVMCDHLEKE
jgi:hypothetical protein